ncbi:MAG TPA: response regulator, partial [Candidatus Omnitrophota bacterium]|nr:response regulator [Candidatus Omnitrophota bacterium]
GFFKEGDFNLIISDWMISSDGPMDLFRSAAARGMKKIGVISANWNFVELARTRFMNVMEVVDCSDLSRAVSLIRSLREEQLRSMDDEKSALEEEAQETPEEDNAEGRPEYPRPMKALVVYEDVAREDERYYERKKTFLSEISEYFLLEEIAPGRYAGEDIEIEYFKAESYDEIWDRITEGDIDIVVNETIPELDRNKGYFDHVYDSVRDANNMPPRMFDEVLSGNAEVSGFIDEVVERRAKELSLYRQDLARWESAHLLREPERPEKLTVLCMQDEPDVVSGEWWDDMIRSKLDPDEYVVLGAKNVADARERFGHMKVDICFSDIMGTFAAEHAKELYVLFRGEDYGIVLSSIVPIKQIPAMIGPSVDIKDRLIGAGFDPEGVHLTVGISSGSIKNRVLAAREKQLKEYEELKKKWEEKVAREASGSAGKSGEDEPLKTERSEEKLPKLRIIIGEDDEDLRSELLGVLMVRFGLSRIDDFHYEGEDIFVTTVASQGDFLDRLSSQDADYAVIDWDLVGGKGPFDMLDALSGKNIMAVDLRSGLPLSFDSKFHDAREKYPDLAIEEFPFEPEDIITRIRQLKEDQIAGYAETSDSAEEAVSPRTRPEKPEKFRVLMVDDNGEMISSVERMLKDSLSEEFEFYSAYRVISSIDLLKNIDFDLVIYDMMLPGSAVPGIDEVFRDKLLKVPHLIVESGGGFPKEAEGPWAELYPRAETLWKGDIIGKLPGIVMSYREEQLRQYEEAVKEWEVSNVNVAPRAEKPAGEKIFIVDDFGDDAANLA